MDRIADPARDAARRRPHRPAVIDVIHDRRQTWHELDDGITALTEKLNRAGVGAGDRVGMSLTPGSGFVETFHAIRRRGAIAVPLNPEAPTADRREKLRYVDARLIITEPESAPPEGETISAIRWSPDESATGADTERPPLHLQSADPACILFTSGTTGKPKAVCHTNGSLHASALASAVRLGHSPADRWLVPLPPHHMGGLAPLTRTALYGTTVIYRSFSVAGIARSLEEHDPSMLSIVPVMLRRLLDADVPLERLRVVLVGGDRTPPRLVERSLEQHVPVHVTYGMTETASQIATATPADLRENPTTVGPPLPWTDISIREAGEIVVSGPMVARGYWGEDGRFDDCYRTGDVGEIDRDGRLFVKGRLDDRIVSGGVTVDPERVLAKLKTHPDVKDGIVLGIEDDRWGERVAALLETPSGKELSEEELLREVPREEQPRQIAFTDCLPRTPSGTVARATVRARLERS